MRSSAILISALVTLAACSGSTANSTGGTTDGGTDSGVTADQATADAANAFCAQVQSCAPAYLTLTYGDKATCVARLSKSIAPQIGAKGSTVTPDLYEACTAALKQASCGDLLARNLPDACRKAGTLADGSACASDSQCANTRCKVAANQVCGTCTSHAKVGAACGVDDDCDYGLSCVNMVCAAFGKQGDSCSASQPCRPDLACRSGSCATPAQLGDACSAFGDCDVPHGLGCDPTASKCVQLSYATTGNACGFLGAGMLVACKGPSGTCTGTSSQNPKGTCAPTAGDGAACDATNGPFCGSPAVCVSGTCKLPDPSACQ